MDEEAYTVKGRQPDVSDRARNNEMAASAPNKKVEVGGFAPPSEHLNRLGPTGLSALNTPPVSVRQQRRELFR